MENQILDAYPGNIPQGKFYKARSLAIATLFGGPLAAGYMLAKNFATLGATSVSGKTWIFTFLIMILFFIALFNVPVRIAPIETLGIIPILSVIVSYVIFTNLQEQQINKHIDAGGELYSEWRALLVGIVCLVITLVGIVGATFIADLMLLF